ncbi:MAG TPA: NAD(P)-binding domain-containing protein, partial [Candidatus Angelobacter sp.]|nr:NAD(P)-binding domain-containing protein [Candidatus Angelobacter sp.]
MIQKVGFVGVGRMGANMARRLAETGFEITAVYDTNTVAAETLAEELHCVAAKDLKSVTALSEVIITVVSDDRGMKQIFNGGLLSRAKGKLFINCASVTPAIHVWVDQKCAARGATS